MILTRLYELAERKALIADKAWEGQPVAYLVSVDENGNYLNPIQESRVMKVVVKKLRGGGEERQEVPAGGTIRKVPRPHGDPAQRGFARFFADTLPRVLPVEVADADREKVERSRATFWRQIDEAADATVDPALKAVQAFGRKLADPVFAETIRAAVAAQKPDAGDRVTFAYYPDGGQTILERQSLKDWYTGYYAKYMAGKQEGGRVGFCTITGQVGPLPTVHPVKLTGVPGGLPTGVSLVSFDKPAFQHYGLDGAANAAIGYPAADGYARAFQWLRQQRDHHFTLGGTLFLYWTRVEVDDDSMAALIAPSADEVAALLREPISGRRLDSVGDANDFYLLAVSGNSARGVIRDYLETKLGLVRDAVRAWFADLRIADPSREQQGRPNAAFALWQLAAATARDADGVGSETQAQLLRAAIGGGPVPDSILGACLHRLEVEGYRGFRAARMGLMKLSLIRRGIAMSEVLDTGDKRLPYLCGQLLAMFERIQYRALGEVNANVVDKYYGGFSYNPFLVLESLQRNARAHLRKMRTDADKKKGVHSLEVKLAELVKLVELATDPEQPRPLFDRYQRTVFSFGYYHQKAKYLAKKDAKAKDDPADNKTPLPTPN